MNHDDQDTSTNESATVPATSPSAGVLSGTPDGPPDIQVGTDGTAKLGPRKGWLQRVVPIGLLFFGFGVYGFVDATIIYPNRGQRHADYLENEYLLQRFQDRNQSFQVGQRPLKAEDLASWRDLDAEDVDIADPRARLTELSDRRSREVELSEAEDLQLQWLQSLDTIGRMDASRTIYVDDEGDPRDPMTRFLELEERVGGTNPPKPLAWWDIPVQWWCFAIGLGIGGLCRLRFLRVRSTPARWNPGAGTLTLPGGPTFAGRDLAEPIDWSKWSRFYATALLGPGHPTHAEQTIKIDLMRRAHVEDVIKWMERDALGVSADDQPPYPDDHEDTADEPAGRDEASEGDRPSP